ncbi:hypothetical protein [Mumia sp. DW29H23]|uniref:hypothetical protein n=1 Tax=Mumia sp. DW29H23 TaxID=3421241 RepID=UPI003D694B52
MDILRAGGTFWRISRRRRPPYDDLVVPWMPALVDGAESPPDHLGHRPIVVTCDGVVMHVEPAPAGRRETERRIKELAEGLYALPWAAGTVDDPPRSPRDPRVWGRARSEWEALGRGLGPLGGV